MRRLREIVRSRCKKATRLHVTRKGVVVAAAVSSLLLCGATAPQSCNSSNSNFSIGPSKGEVIGIAVGAVAVVAVGTVILVEVHKDHHTVKGCVLVGANGVQVQNESDHKIYTVTGATQNVKPGDRVRLRGNKEKLPKGSTADRVFVVEKFSKDYGPCKTATTSPTP